MTNRTVPVGAYIAPFTILGLSLWFTTLYAIFDWLL